MPVLVTAADSRLGRLIVQRLLTEGGEVRAYCSGGGDAGGLRSAGAIIATGSLQAEGHLEAAMEHAHTVVHPVVGPDAPSTETLEADAVTVLTAAIKAEVRRLIVLSVPRAAVDHPDPLRSAAGRVERRLRGAPAPSVVLRCSLIDGPVLRGVLASAPVTAAALDTVVAPVRESDVVEVIALFDSMRSTADSGHVVFHADGPARMSLAGYLERVGVGLPGEDDRAVGRRFRSPDERPLLVPSLEHPWVTDDPDIFDAWDFTDLRPAPVTEGNQP